MSRFGGYVINKFAGCRCLAKTYDIYRKRTVRVYMLPGEFEHIGVSDETDHWIAPVVADPFSVKIKQILDDIRAGKTVVYVEDGTPPKRERRRLQFDTPSAPVQPPRKERRRINV